MRLAEYLAREKISQAEFARRSGLSPGMVSLLVRNLTFLSRKTARQVLRASGGKVTPNDFVRAQ